MSKIFIWQKYEVDFGEILERLALRTYTWLNYKYFFEANWHLLQPTSNNKHSFLALFVT